MHVYFLLLIFDILGYSIWCKHATIYYNNTRRAVAVGEGSFRLGVFSGGPTLYLFDMLLVIGGGWGNWCSPCGSPSPFIIGYASGHRRGVWELDVPFVVHPLRWFFCLLGQASFHFVPCIPLFLGALVYLWLAEFHHTTHSDKEKMTRNKYYPNSATKLARKAPVLLNRTQLTALRY
jgi:hypothetical protein